MGVQHGSYIGSHRDAELLCRGCDDRQGFLKFILGVIAESRASVAGRFCQRRRSIRPLFGNAIEY
jgi:hypothetical protein